MPAVPITTDWWLELDDAFERRTEGGDLVLWHGTRTVYASVFRGGNADADSAIAAMLEARKETPVRTFDRVEGNVIGHAYLLREHDESRGEYWGLNTWTASRGSMACVTFYFQSLADLGWALAGWRSVQCGPCEAYVN
jgi:hypothetical protein